MDPILLTGFISMLASALTVIVVTAIKRKMRNRGPDDNPDNPVTITY